GNHQLPSSMFPSLPLSANHAVFLTCLGIHSLLGTSAFWLASTYLRRRAAATASEARLLSRLLPAEGDLPDVLIQLPTFNERDLILRAAHALKRLDWPRQRLHVQILDDSTDPQSRTAAHSAVALLCGALIDAALITRENRAGFKAGALAAGLDRS